MKIEDQTKVIDLLVGKGGIKDSETRSQILAYILSMDGNEISNCLNYAFDTTILDSIEVSKIVKALLVAFTTKWDEFFSYVDHLLGKDTPRIQVLFEGVLIGIVEAGLFLLTFNDMQKVKTLLIPKRLAIFLIGAVMRKNRGPITDEVSGRLANISGEFIRRFECDYMFKRLNQCADIQNRLVVADAASDKDSALQAISEFTTKYFFGATLRRRIEMVVS